MNAHSPPTCLCGTTFSNLLFKTYYILTFVLTKKALLGYRIKEADNMTTTCVATERLRKALANEPDVDRKLATQLVRYLHAYELGRLNSSSQPENIIWMEHAFFNFLVFCRKEVKVSAPAPQGGRFARKE